MTLRVPWERPCFNTLATHWQHISNTLSLGVPEERPWF